MSTVCSAQSQMFQGEKTPAARFAKTKICTFHLRRKCTRGEACTFAHDNEELAPLPDFHCTRLCTSFLRSGTCGSGDSCTFAHSADELRNNNAIPGPVLQEKMAQPPNPTLRKVDMCKFFLQGRCLRGESCTFAHGDNELQQRPNLYRTSACFAFSQGKCKAGDNCKYSHSLDIAPRDEAKLRQIFDKPSDEAPDAGSHVVEIEQMDEFTIPTRSKVKSSLEIALKALKTKKEGLEFDKSSMVELDRFDVDLFNRQTTCGSFFSSPSRDLDSFPTQFSRQTTWAYLEDDDADRQVSNFPTQWSRQTTWANFEDDDADCQGSLGSNVNIGKDSVDGNENNAVASPIQVLDILDELKTHQTSLADTDAEETSLSGSESTGASSSVRSDDRLAQEEIDNQCARLRNISGLYGLEVSVKNTFLAFDDHDRQVLVGTASLRARSFA